MNADVESHARPPDDADPADHRDVAGSQVAACDAGDGLLAIGEDPRGTREPLLARVRNRTLRNGSAGREAAAQHRDRGIGAERVGHRADDAAVGRPRLGGVLGECASGDRQLFTVQQGEQLADDRRSTARVLEGLDEPGSVGPHRAQQGRLSTQGAVRLPDVDLDAGLDRDRLQMLDRVHRSADREHDSGGVAHGCGGDDVAGTDVTRDQVDDRRRRSSHRVPHAVAVRPHRR